MNRQAMGSDNSAGLRSQPRIQMRDEKVSSPLYDGICGHFAGMTVLKGICQKLAECQDSSCLDQEIGK